MLDVKELCDRLSRYHWSPQPPSTYTLGQGRGLGAIAHNCYGTFNLIWATHELDTTEQHLTAIKAFSVQRTHSEQVVKGAAISDWMTLLNPAELAVWYRSNGVYVNIHTRQNIEKALNNYTVNKLVVFRKTS